MTFKKLNLVAAIALVLLLPILLVGCGKEDTDSQPDLTRFDVEELVRAEIAKIPAATPVTPGLSRNEVEQVVQASIVGMPEPETVPTLTRADVNEVVQSALEAAMAQMPEPQPEPADPGLTLADVREVVQAAMASILESAPGLTAADIEAIVQSAIAGIPEPEAGLTRADVEEIVSDAVAEVAEPAPRLTREEVRRLARNAVATIPLKTVPADYTKFFVDNAISRYDEDGLDDTLSYYNRVDSVDGQWYVFIIDENDEVIGHYDAHRIGQDLKGPIGTDANGYNFGPEMLSATGEGKWVSYVFRNPDSGSLGSDRSGTLQLKNAWVVRHNGLLFASGWYVNADEFTKALVFAAVNKFRSVGLEATIAYFTGPESVYSGLAAAIDYYNSAQTVEGEWFAFIADSSGTIVDHYNKALVGTDLKDLLGTDMFEATAEGNWVTTEDVRVWVVSYDWMTFGSGWHHDEMGS